MTRSVSGLDNENHFYTPLRKVRSARIVDVTSGRARAMVIAGVGLISLIIGGLALARSGGRTAAIVALVLGLIGVVLSAVHLAGSTGFGTGGGRAGAIVGLVLALIGTTLGGLVLARARRSNSD